MRETMKELELPWAKLKGLTTDRAPSIIGKRTCLMGTIKREMDKGNTEIHMERYCVFHQQSLF
jgi:hypothetical protein